MVDSISEPQGNSLPVFPLNVVLFPGMELPLHIFEERYQIMINDCLDKEQLFGVTLLQHGTEAGSLAEPHLVGTTARVIDVEHLDEGRMNIRILGVQRFRLLELVSLRPYLVASVHLYNESEYLPDRSLDRLIKRARRVYLQYARSLGELMPDIPISYQLPNDPVNLANFIAAHFETLGLSQRQSLLEILDVEALLNREICWLIQEDRRIRISLLVRKKLLEIEEKHGQPLKNKQWLN